MSGDSGEKLNIELNLVPFIDLLSSLVLFLLLTAVWVQVSAINSQIQKKGAASAAKREDEQLSIRLTQAGFELSWPTALTGDEYPAVIPKSNNAFDYPALQSRLKQGMAKMPSLSASVNADDEVDYGAVIRTIDAGKQSGLPTVGLEG